MTLDEAKKIFINKGFVNIDGTLVFNGDKWREACTVISEWLQNEECDAISLDNAIEAVYGLCDKSTGIFEENPHIDAVLEVLENLPSVNPQPKTGHWINKSKQSYCGVTFIHIECSKCGESSGLNNTYARYCPWCGAKMESEEV